MTAKELKESLNEIPDNILENLEVRLYDNHFDDENDLGYTEISEDNKILYLKYWNP